MQELISEYVSEHMSVFVTKDANTLHGGICARRHVRLSRQFVRINCRIHVRVKIWVRICVRTISEFMSGLMSEYFIIPCGINVRIYVRRNVWTFDSIHVRVNVPIYVRISVYAYLLPESMSVLPEAMSEKMLSFISGITSNKPSHSWGSYFQTGPANEEAPRLQTISGVDHVSPTFSWVVGSFILGVTSFYSSRLGVTALTINQGYK